MFLGTFPSVAIVGVRQCGKTTLLGSLSSGWERFDMERRAVLDVVTRDPDTFFRLNGRQVALAEAQLAPEVLPALRVAIDEQLDEVRFRRFVGMLGGLSRRVLNYSEVGRARSLSQPTVRDYFDIAHGTFLWRRIPAFTRDAAKRTVKHPWGYLRDTGLLHALLRIPDLDALLSHPQMGPSWEGLVVEEILRQLGALGVGHDASY